jgi:tetratricopeptide (TPR) repeat protein
LSGHHDIFICHDQASTTSVKRLASALAARGASCHTHEGGISAEISHKLAISKLFLVFGNEGFFESRGCQAHLALAWIATSCDLHRSPSRILVVNPEEGTRHIYPLCLKERIIADALEVQDLQKLASELHQHCESISGNLGELFPPAHKRCVGPFDAIEKEPLNFGGRNRELWDIHRSLKGTLGESPTDAPFVVISGGPGFGKTLIALEYAFRFGAAYPGGIFRISGKGAEPAAKFSQLAMNAPLKPQLLALLRQLSPETECSDKSSLTKIREALADQLDRMHGDYLWIVDDLPEGINGPVIQQWLAPVKTAQNPHRAHNILITESQRYDHRGDPIHLPLLSEISGQMILTWNKPPTRNDERDSLNWLTDEIGRHPRFAGIAAGILEAERHDRRSTLGRLAQRISRRNRLSSEISLLWARDFPEGREKSAANLLLDAIQSLGGAARDILRLALELEDHAIPIHLIAECLVIAGLSADERKEDLFTIFLNEPEETPMSHEDAETYVLQGAEQIAALGLGQLSDKLVTLPSLVIRGFSRISSTSPRQTLLAEASLQALYIIAESAHSSQNFDELSAVAPHARKLVGDLRDRMIAQEDNAGEITGRIRLALHLADLDLLHGAKTRATALYRATSAYLVRAMAADPHNSTRQKDFARVQEQLGDLMIETTQSQSALDHYRKSLGIRTFMAKQEGGPGESIQDALRLNIKIARLQRRLGDFEAALQTQQTAHALHLKLAQMEPESQEAAFDVASSHAQLGELHIKLNQSDEGLRELKKALPLFETLAETVPSDLRYSRAPGAIHNRIGDLLHARDDLTGALSRYRTALSAAESLAQRNPHSPELQRDLAVCHDNIGDTLSGLDDAQEADQHFKAFLSIAEASENQSAFKDLRAREIAAVHMKLGRGREAEKMPRLALERYLLARTMIEKLAIDFPENLRLREDLQWLRHKISRLSERLEAEDRRIARNRANIPESPASEGSSDWQGDA